MKLNPIIEAIIELETQRDAIIEALKLLNQAKDLLPDAAMEKLTAAVNPPSKTGFQPLDVRAKTHAAETLGLQPKKPGRKPKPVQTPEEAKAAVKTILQGDGQPTTLAGAAKRVLREATKPLTILQVCEETSNRWPSLVAGRELDSINVSIGYWSAKGHLEKLGQGSLAMFRVLEPDFFKETE